MTATNNVETGHQALASFLSKSRTVMESALTAFHLRVESHLHVIRPILLTNHTARTQTEDWIARSRNVIVKLRPDTTYWSNRDQYMQQDDEGADDAAHFVDYCHHDTCGAIGGDGQG